MLLSWKYAWTVSLAMRRVFFQLIPVKVPIRWYKMIRCSVSKKTPSMIVCMEKPDQAFDPRACLSRTGYVIFYANCPIIWQSKLQTTIALSTTEAEYVALSMAMRDVIYFMNHIDEMKDFGITLPGVNTHCERSP